MQPSPQALAFNPAFQVWTPAVVSALVTVFTTLLNLRITGKPKFSWTCLFTLGLLPLVIYFALYAAFLPNLLMRPGPLWSGRFLDLFIVFVFVTPSYPISFIIAASILIHGKLNRRTIGGGIGIGVGLIILHLAGLLYSLHLSRTLS